MPFSRIPNGIFCVDQRFGTGIRRLKTTKPALDGPSPRTYLFARGAANGAATSGAVAFDLGSVCEESGSSGFRPRRATPRGQELAAKFMRRSTLQPFEAPGRTIRNRAGGSTDGHNATRAPEGRGCRKRRRRVCQAMVFRFTRKASHQVAYSFKLPGLLLSIESSSGTTRLGLCNTSSKSRCRKAAKAKAITECRGGRRSDLTTQPSLYVSADNFPQPVRLAKS